MTALGGRGARRFFLAGASAVCATVDAGGTVMDSDPFCVDLCGGLECGRVVTFGGSSGIVTLTSVVETSALACFFRPKIAPKSPLLRFLDVSADAMSGIASERPAVAPQHTSTWTGEGEDDDGRRPDRTVPAPDDFSAESDEAVATGCRDGPTVTELDDGGGGGLAFL